MKDAVFLADIDYARKLLSAGCEHSAIVAALCYRGMSESRAEQFLNDLVLGKKVEVEVPRTPGSSRRTYPPRPRPQEKPPRRWFSWKAFIILYALASAVFFIIYFFIRLRAAPAAQESPSVLSQPLPIDHAPSWRN